MKENLKKSGLLFLKLLVVNFMCAIIVFSINILANGFLSNEVGYTAFGTIEGSEESETLYNYYFDDGEDTKRAEYEAKGYVITEYPIKELTKKTQNFATAFSQVLCVFLLASFIHAMIWDIGFKDGNLVKFKHKEADVFRGLKIGLFTIIPAVVLLVFLFAAGSITAKVPIVLYKLINSSLYGFLDFADGNSIVVGDLSVFNFMLMFAAQLIIPLIAHISYILGFKNISLSEKIVYKKNK